MTVKILAIETSCDETAAAVLADGREILSNIIASQIDIHQPYGGVVPEIASRQHLQDIVGVVEAALLKAGVVAKDLSAVAVTYGPGLIGSLLVGVSYAKALSLAWQKPLIAVHHLEGHIMASFLENPDLHFPFVALVVSGSHSSLVYVKKQGEYELLGQSKDDAAGEAFDKIARALGLPYPGGPSIQKAAAAGEAVYNFPRAWLGEDDLNFSFSGLKSSVLNFLNQKEMKGENYKTEDVAASAQEAIVQVLAVKAARAVAKTGVKTLVLAGGVAANLALRQALAKEMPKTKIVYPSPIFCTDNAAMIACAAYNKFLQGDFAKLDLNAYASLSLYGAKEK